MYLLVLSAPLISTLIILLFGRCFYKIDNIQFIFFGFFFSICTSFLIFYEVILNKTSTVIVLKPWIACSILSVEWSFLFDFASCVLILVILIISCIVHIFSLSYMALDPHFCRFFSFLGLFTFFMLLFVTANNFVIMFLGWEGVGLVSYLLISFWFTRIQASKAALKAIIINRISDCFLYFGLVILFYKFKTFDYILIFSLIQFIDLIESNDLFIAAFCILIGAVGKSAQFGLHTWLPDAMEGPTPVSALLHAATMVTAGIFLLIRCSYLFYNFSNLSLLMLFIGGLTSFLAGSIGCFQNDIKKIIAYSTCSQLGYMFMACGLSAYNIALFHLFTHAFFKALLFLGAGCIIHVLANEQDIRFMGGLFIFLPVVLTCMIIGSLSLMGLPYLSGFYSKDILLEILWWKFSISGLFVYWIGWLSVIWTSIYSIRLLYLVFFNKISNIRRNFIYQITEFNFLVIPLLIFLAVFSIFIGYLFRPLFWEYMGNSVGTSQLFVVTYNLNYFDSSFNSFQTHLFLFYPLLAVLIGFVYSFFLFFKWKNFILNIWFRFWYFCSNQKWFFDVIYQDIISYWILNQFYKLGFKLIDRGIIEWFVGSSLLTKWIYFYTKKIMQFNSGQLVFYLVFSILIISFFFIIFFIIL